MSEWNRKRTFTLGGETFKRFSLSTKKKTFKHGGWCGIVLFIDTFMNKKVICRTMHLNRYLDGINFESVKRGKFGKDVRDMAFDYIEVYYYEVQDYTKIRDYKNYFNREITKAKKATTNQLELDFSARKKRSNRNVA